jgi:hypothetical protein
MVKQSSLVAEYNQTLDRESAFEILNRRMQNDDDSEITEKKQRKSEKSEQSTFEKMLKSPVVRSMGVSVAGMITRSLLGSLGLKTSSRKYKRK